MAKKRKKTQGNWQKQAHTIRCSSNNSKQQGKESRCRRSLTQLTLQQGTNRQPRTECKTHEHIGILNAFQLFLWQLSMKRGTNGIKMQWTVIHTGINTLQRRTKWKLLHRSRGDCIQRLKKQQQSMHTAVNGCFVQQYTHIFSYVRDSAQQESECECEWVRVNRDARTHVYSGRLYVSC